MSEEKTTKKEMTMDDLARMMNDGFEKSDKQTDKKIESLARIVQNGFLDMEERFEKIKTDIEEVKSDTEYIKAEVHKKVDKIVHNELVYRVEKMEEKFA